MTSTTTLNDLTGYYVLDPAGTRIGFVGRHTMATRVYGHFDRFDGDAHLDGDEPSKSSADLTIEANSIQTGNRRRDEQVSDKFLDAGHHPAITFSSTGVDQVGASAFEVTGDLTIRGVTRPVTVHVELTGAERDPSRVGLRGGVTINRKDWGVNWNAATAVLISETVGLEFDLVAIRRVVHRTKD